MAMNIAAWFRQIGLEQYEQAFLDNEIDERTLLHLTGDDLKDLGVTVVGHRVLLLQAIAALKPGTSAGPKAADIDQPRSQPAGERRQLTVMFVDLIESTALSRRLDPEEMQEVLRAYHDAVAAQVLAFEGHVAKFMGDGVLAYFGWPKAHEDEAERAVRAGLATIPAVSGLQTPAGEALAARVGVATGLVVVGDLIGRGSAREEAAVGETLNLAARLQGLAEPGSVTIAEGTRRLLGGLFDLEEIQAPPLKGFLEPLRAFRVRGEVSAESRFEARYAADIIPLVGREQELALLLDRWQLATRGEGQVVLLAGEPGIGKSRIALALRERLRAEPRTRLSYSCSPYHASSALWPVIQQLERASGFAREDTAPQKLAKLEALLARAVPDPAGPTSLLAGLLGLPLEDRYPPLELTPSQRKVRTSQALLNQLEGLAQRQPILMVLEDAHWLDPTTKELFDLVIDRIQRLSVLLVVTFRPEFIPSWTAFPHVTLLTLNRLARSQAATLINQITAGRALPREVVETILARTEGVPLFVEELTKTILESGVVRETPDGFELAALSPSLAIPTTLQDSLMARLDRLAPTKEVAQVAACIGREFGHELLAAVAGLAESQLKESLEQLNRAELVFRRGTPPEATYSFKHVLVRDAAYESLLKSRRQLLHARIAGAIEGRFSALAEAQPEILAHHLTEAGLPEQAITWWRRAGEQAFRRSAMPEAERHFSRALELLRTLPETESRPEAELALLTQLGPVLIHTKGWARPEVHDVYSRALEIARGLDQPLALVPPLAGLWVTYNFTARYDAAREVVDEMFRAAERSSDDSVLVQAHHTALGTMWVGDFLGCRRHAVDLLAIYDEERHRQHRFLYLGHDPAVCGNACGALAHWMLGDIESGAAAIADAEALGRRLKHVPSLAHALWLKAKYATVTRDPTTTLAAAEEVLALAREFKLAVAEASALSHKGWALVHLGEVEEGNQLLEAGLAMWRSQRSSMLLPHRLCLLAEGRLAAGRRDEALAIIDEALGQIERTNEQFLASKAPYSERSAVVGRSGRA
jgi:class 3 adenylate cyclase/predicted ATPase